MDPNNADLISDVQDSSQTESKLPQPEVQVDNDQGNDLKNSDIASELAEIKQTIGRLEELFEKKIINDSVKEKAFDRLYIDLDEYKKGIGYQFSRTIIADLILLYDRISFTDISSIDDDVNRLFCSVADEIEEILYRNGVEKIESESSRFDPSMQKAIDVERTTDQKIDNTIAKVIRRGFILDSKVIRPEEVVVFKYDAPDAKSERSTEEKI